MNREKKISIIIKLFHKAMMVGMQMDIRIFDSSEVSTQEKIRIETKFMLQLIIETEFETSFRIRNF